MIRYADWRIFLTAYVEQYVSNHFVWRTDDCCVFSSGAVKVMTGVDLIADVEYHDETSARQLMSDRGGLVQIMIDLLGHPVNSGKMGDVAFSRFPTGAAVGIHMGQHALFRGAEGLVIVPLTDCIFFKVG